MTSRLCRMQKQFMGGTRLVFLQILKWFWILYTPYNVLNLSFNATMSYFKHYNKKEITLFQH